MCSPHFSISFSSLTIAHKISTNRALAFFVLELDAISFREQKQITLPKQICNNVYFDQAYFRLLELDHGIGTLDQSICL